MNEKKENACKYLSEIFRNMANTLDAKRIWAKGSEVNGTPAEKYLVQVRHLPKETIKKMNIRSYKGKVGISAFDNNKPYEDYVLIPVYKFDGQMAGIQLIQIDPEGNKATKKGDKNFYPKIYLGSFSKSNSMQAAVIQKTQDLRVVFIAEGIETAASVAAINKIGDRFSILASLGVDKLVHTLGYVQTHFPPNCLVVFLKDNDGNNQESQRAFSKAKDAFLEAGFQVKVLEPSEINTDWNDVLIEEGIPALQEKVSAQLALDEVLSAFNPMDLSRKMESYREVSEFMCWIEKLAVKTNLYSTFLAGIDEIRGRITQLNNDPQSDIEKICLILRDIETIRILTLFDNEIQGGASHLDIMREIANEYMQFEKRRNCELEDKEDIPDDVNPQDAPNGDLYKAYHYAAHDIQKQLESYSEQTLYSGGCVKFSISRSAVNLKFDFYYSQFINEVNKQLEANPDGKDFGAAKKISLNALKEFYKKLRGELVTNHANKREIILQKYRVQSKLVVSAMNTHLLEIEKKILKKQKSIEQKLAYLLEGGKEVYLDTMNNLDTEEQIVVQEWINQISGMRLGSIFAFQYPKQNLNKGKVELLDYDSDTEESLLGLTNFIMEEQSTSSSDMESPSNENCAQAKRKYSLQLAANLYKSFTLIDPLTKQQQEFDGLVVREGRLTVVERKTNAGTGSGILQRNFCQNKINSKEKFLKKGVIARILSERNPEDFVLLKEPDSPKLSHSAQNLNKGIKENLIRKIKLDILKAMSELTLEFVVNKPTKGFSFSNYNELFFNKDLCKIMKLRFSKLGKGNEEVAHELVDSVATKVSKSSFATGS